MAEYTVVDKELCESGMRYIVEVEHSVAVWLNEHFNRNYDFFWVDGYGRGANHADISEDILILMGLKWT